MAIRQVVVSDITGKEIPEDKHSTVIVTDHPSLRGAPKRLDASTDEVAKLATGKLSFVSLTIHDPNTPPRKVILDVAAFDALFKGTTADEAISNAETVENTPTGRAGGRGRPKGSGGKPKAAKGEKIDYLSPDWYGVLHRGRVTPAEAALVRDNLTKAQANRKREGQAAINPESEDDQKRYFS